MNQIIIIICFFVLPLFGLNQIHNFGFRSNNDVKPKLCIDCKYFITDGDTGKFGKCSLFPVIEDEKDYVGSLVNGIKEDEIIHYRFCSTARMFDNMCGKKGKMYKTKM